MAFVDSPFFFIVAAFVIAGVAFAVRAFVGYRSVASDARAEYAFRRERGMIRDSVTEEQFASAFRRVYGPRAPAHLALAILAIIVSAPLSLRLADLVMTGVWKMSGESRTFEPLFLVYQFGVFFLVILFAALIALFVAQRYHSRTVERIEDVLYGEDALRRSGMGDLVSLGRILMGVVLALAVMVFVFVYAGWAFGLATFVFIAPLLAVYGSRDRLMGKRKRR